MHVQAKHQVRCQAGGKAVPRERNGGQGRNRTTDTRIFNPLLYRLSYLAVPDAAGNPDALKGADYKGKSAARQT
jgi:hypothetical protein